MSSRLEPRFDSEGLVPVILQESLSKRVLMLAYMNTDAFSLTKEHGTCHFFSRSRNEIWHKGATSGNYMRVVSMELDCDSDALLIQVNPTGPACHTGSESCFDAEISN
jgi:phosphoribosyl-AMP cyclohydrolase / phosphoribosyl-ATP pyrophosphohydrolase